MTTALLIIKRWWDAEWLFIQPELSRLDELKKIFVTRTKAIDLNRPGCSKQLPSSGFSIEMPSGSIVSGMTKKGIFLKFR